MGWFSSKSSKGSGNVKTTKEFGLPGCGFPGNGEKTTNGEYTGRGRNAHESNKAFQKACKKGK